MNTRQTELPGPPPAFNPPTRDADPNLQADHMRLRPEDRFRSAQRPNAMEGVNVMNGIPPHVRMGAPPDPTAKPPAPALYPAYRYHKTKAPAGVVVKDPDEEEKVCAGDGWQKFPFPAERVATAAERLELLEDILHSLGELAYPEEEPIEVLDRIILERQSFALRIANHPQESPDALDEAAQAIATKPKKGK